MDGGVGQETTASGTGELQNYLELGCYGGLPPRGVDLPGPKRCSPMYVRIIPIMGRPILKITAEEIVGRRLRIPITPAIPT